MRFNPPDDLLRRLGRGPIFPVGQFFQGRQGRPAHNDKRHASTAANVVVPIGHALAQQAHPGVHCRIRLRRFRPFLAAALPGSGWLCARKEHHAHTKRHRGQRDQRYLHTLVHHCLTPSLNLAA
jgi:hypothetical protein